MIPRSKNLVNILSFVPNCMTMSPTMAPITLMDTVWSVSRSLSRYIRVGRSFISLSRLVTGSDKEKSKLALAADLAAQAMKTIGFQHQVILLCGSWYPKAEVTALVEQFENLEMVCNARLDTTLYGFPPLKSEKRPSKKVRKPDPAGGNRPQRTKKRRLAGWRDTGYHQPLKRQGGICPGYRTQKRKGKPPSVFMYG